MRGHRIITLIVAAVLAAGLPASAWSATDTRQVPTQKITPPPGDMEDDDSVPAGPMLGEPEKDAAPTAPAPANEVAPVVEYDFSKLPPAVQKMRNALLTAAKTGDIAMLKPIIDGDTSPPNLGATDSDDKDPIKYLKSLSGDPDGREILAILSEILEAGYVHVDVGTPQEQYIWPYFARYPIDKLTPPQMVELFRLLTASDFEEMKSFGAYLFYRVGIAPDGNWTEFQAGD